ncbi:MAG: HlyD family efflux transporter periplasmic adaptor subunit [Ectothiorhodospiraceae bacterium]|nr:HlyD family efflux transporter periplasmic adaptor subunit [Planctomycetota bacterium]MCP5154249.1 HlyD family efflux transporter periplasmic adaptor subunit [Ectothiorhodospiraceae bacterium]
MASHFSRTTRALASDSNRGALVTWALATVLLAAWLAWFLLGRVTIYEVSTAARLEVARAAHPVAPQVAGRIAVVHLAIGQRVTAGEVVAEIDASAESLALREEEARRASIAPQIASLRREIAARQLAVAEDREAAAAAQKTAHFRLEEAESAVGFGRENERRLKGGMGAGGVAPIDALRAAAQARQLGAAREAAAAELARVRADAQSRAQHGLAEIEDLTRELLALESGLETSEATIARLRLDLERHHLRAPVSGVVGSVEPPREGTYVTAGERLATIVPDGDLVVVATFDPSSVFGRIHPGQSATVRLDGFPWAQYGTVEASVTRVGAEIVDGLVRVELTPRSDDSGTTGPTMLREVLQHGLPGSVEVQVEEATPVMLVLRAAGQLVARPAVAAPVGGAR